MLTPPDPRGDYEEEGGADDGAGGLVWPWYVGQLGQEHRVSCHPRVRGIALGALAEAVECLGVSTIAPCLFRRAWATVRPAWPSLQPGASWHGCRQAGMGPWVFVVELNHHQSHWQ